MSDLKRALADLAERGTPIGADRLRDRVMLDLAPGSSSAWWRRVDARRPAILIPAAVIATLVLVGAVPLLFGWMGTSEFEATTATTVAEPQPVPPAPVLVGDGQTVSVTVTDVTGHDGDELAGVLYAGGDLTDLDSDALGGFRSVVDGNDFTTTEVVREPGTPGIGPFPHVTDQALTVAPGTYTLVVWVDVGLGGFNRWVPVNSDGMGLYGCQAVFEVGGDAQTDVVVPANLVPNGWNTDCATGAALPGTDAAAAVAPSMDGDGMWWPELEMSMPPVEGAGDGQTVSVTVTDVTGHDGDELAGVLYAGGDLTDLESDALGGFWSVVDGNDFTTTEVVREPGVFGENRFPFIADQALAVTPGTYTLVMWVDAGLGPMSRWVPVNSDGMGLYGCQAVFEVGDDTQTDVAVTADFVSNGWNTDCTTGVAIPGTDAAAAVAPPVSPDDAWTQEREMSMPPPVGVGEGQTVTVTVTDVTGHPGYELAGVLYAGGELTDLESDALGGFWSVVDGSDFTTTEVVREPGEPGMGSFPHVTDQALTVAPGRYTLVVWVDVGLGGLKRWVPINSDGSGLYGCQMMFVVGDDTQTDVVVPANLVPDGWNTNCSTAEAIPGTDAAAAVAPPMNDYEG